MISSYNLPGACGRPIALDLTQTNPDQPKPLVVFAHGFKGFKDWGTHHIVANYFAENHLNFLKFNFSHNGLTQPHQDIFDDLEGFATNTFSKQLFDLNEVVTFALSGKEFIRPTAIYLLGHSLGGAISIIHAAENKFIDKLCTWASISNFKTLWSPEQEHEWRNKGVLHFSNSRTNQQMPINSSLLEDLTDHSQRLNVIAATKKVKQPWLIVHGKEDTSVPYKQALELFDQTTSELLIIPCADHVFNARHPWKTVNLPRELKIACDATIAFFARQ